MNWQPKILEKAMESCRRFDSFKGWVMFDNWVPTEWSERKPKASGPGLLLVEVERQRFYASLRDLEGKANWFYIGGLPAGDISDSEMAARIMLAKCLRRLRHWEKNQKALGWPESCLSEFDELARSIEETLEMELEV